MGDCMENIVPHDARVFVQCSGEHTEGAAFSGLSKFATIEDMCTQIVCIPVTTNRMVQWRSIYLKLNLYRQLAGDLTLIQCITIHNLHKEYYSRQSQYC